MAGYSDTPLVRKLGIKPGHRVAFPGAPDGFAEELGPLPDGVTVDGTARGPLDVVVAFNHRADQLRTRFARHRDALVVDGALWIAWPKLSSGVATDLDRGLVMAVGHCHGVVDNKICAIDETWSALRFVRRVEDRG